MPRSRRVPAPPPETRDGFPLEPAANPLRPDAPPDETAELFRLVNAHRRRQGVGPLTASPVLSAAARTKAVALVKAGAGPFGHTIDGVTAEQNKLNHGYPADSPGWGEVIQWGVPTAAEAFRVWAQSPDHEDVLSDARMVAVGLAGPVGAPGTGLPHHVWVGVFGSVIDAPVKPTPKPKPEPNPKPTPGPTLVPGGGMRPTDRIIAPARGDQAAIRATMGQWNTLRWDDALTYFAEVFALAPKLGLDPAVVLAQWHLETGGGTTAAWTRNLNPGGIGVTDGGDVSIDYRTGENAARGQLLHLWAYATTAPVPPELAPYLHLDPRFPLVQRGSAPTIQGLQGRWATDPNYAAKLCARGNAIWLNLPGQGVEPEPKPDPKPKPKPGRLNMIKGLVPLPSLTKRLVTPAMKPAGVGWDDLGPREVWGLSRHRMQGTLWGTDDYFHRADIAALTDFGIDHQTGEIIQWLDPRGRMTPHASGPVSNPYGDGAAFIAKWQGRYGVSVVNRMRVSVEISGYFAQPGTSITADSPWSDASKRAFARIMAHYAHDYGIEWSDFPMHPGDGFSFLVDHVEFTRGTGKVCAGRVVAEATDEVIGYAKDIMRAAQTGGGVTPPPPAPEPGPALAYPTGMSRAWATALFGRVEQGGIVYAFNELGPVSRLWLDLGIAQEPHLFPALERVEKGAGGEYFVFDGGRVLYRKNDRAAFAVLGDNPPTDKERAA